MATLSVTIPNAITPRVIDGVAYNNGYTDTIQDIDGNVIPNPISKAQYCKNLVKEWIRANVISYEAKKAGDAARDAAQVAAGNEIVIQD